MNKDDLLKRLAITINMNSGRKDVVVTLEDKTLVAMSGDTCIFKYNLATHCNIQGTISYYFTAATVAKIKEVLFPNG